MSIIVKTLPHKTKTKTDIQNGEKIMTTFPKDFLWGAAASAPQTEGAANQGGKSATTWDYWYQTDPSRFYNHVGPQETSNVYFQYHQPNR